MSFLCSDQYADKYRLGDFTPACPDPRLTYCQADSNINASKKIYFATDNTKIYSLNLLTNLFTQECGSQSSINTIGFHPSGVLYTIYQSVMRRIRLLTGTAHTITAAGLDNDLPALVFDQQGNAWAFNFGTKHLFKISGINPLNDTVALTITDYGAISNVSIVGGGDLFFYNQLLYLVAQVGVGGPYKLIRIDFTSTARTALAATPGVDLGIIKNTVGTNLADVVSASVLNNVIYVSTFTTVYSLALSSPNPIGTLVATVPGGYQLLDSATILESSYS